MLANYHIFLIFSIPEKKLNTERYNFTAIGQIKQSTVLLRIARCCNSGLLELLITVGRAFACFTCAKK